MALVPCSFQPGEGECLAIERVGVGELRRRIECLHLTVLDYHDPITNIERRHAMCDDDDSHVLFEFHKGLTDESLATHI